MTDGNRILSMYEKYHSDNLRKAGFGLSPSAEFTCTRALQVLVLDLRNPCQATGINATAFQDLSTHFFLLAVFAGWAQQTQRQMATHKDGASWINAHLEQHRRREHQSDGQHRTNDAEASKIHLLGTQHNEILQFYVYAWTNVTLRCKSVKNYDPMIKWKIRMTENPVE